MRALLAAMAMACLGGGVPGAELNLLSGNLLSNAGFETADPATGFARGWMGYFSPDWGECAGAAALSTEQPHGGERSVEVSGVRARYAVGTDRIPVDPQKAYLLRAWVRTSLRGGEQAYIVASWFGSDGWLSLQRSAALRGVRPWQQIEMLLLPDARDAQATSLQVSCRVTSGSGAGAAWFDDVALFECAPPPPEPRARAEQRRYRNLVREMLIHQAVWRERTRVLQRRRADLEVLLRQDATSFERLVARHGKAVRERRFLFREERPFAEIEDEVLADGGTMEDRLDQLQEAPDPRDLAFAELEAMLPLKQRVAAAPDLRRFYLWAQLRALRAERSDPRHAGRSPSVHPEYGRLAAAGGDGSERGALDAVVSPRLDIVRDRGFVHVAARAYTDPGPRRLHAALLDAAGNVVALKRARVSSKREPGAQLRLVLRAPRYWYPDCPYTYQLVLTLWRRDELEDTWRGKVAFRDIRCMETDVTATMRHAWDLPLTDYSLIVNGQPFFPTGTVCGGSTPSGDIARQQADLFEELWLDFQRTYGFRSGGSDGDRGRVFDERGLGFLASVRPSYTAIRSYVTGARGFEDYRERLREARRSLHHPSILTLEVGNEAELAIWGASLPTYYGDELWHCFDEAARCVREELSPGVPVGYVRAGTFSRVAPVPREDYSGVNQYTGRYGGRISTIAADLASLSRVATFEDKPFGITEWNGPKYSWATGGIGGVTEGGSAHYIYRYYDTMLRTPGVMLSTEFVLNWVVMPIEDLTTVPIDEGLAWRQTLRWSKQKGCDWYPHVWPPGPADTPARRAMRGFQSPMYFLRGTPGEIVIVHPVEHAGEAEQLRAAMAPLGKGVRCEAAAGGFDLATLDANGVVIGGIADDQPKCVRELERMGVLGMTDASFPRAGGFLIQERVNPYFPDRYLVAVTAADEAGMRAALAKLAAGAAGLAEALERDASCRRIVALIDDNDTVWWTFSRYVLELPSRGVFRGGDDIRTSLSAAEFFDAEGARSAKHADMAALIIAVSRPLTDGELAIVQRLAAQGANIVISWASYDADEKLRHLLGVRPGRVQALTEDLPVEGWAQQPLAVPQLGEVRAAAIRAFGQIAPGSDGWLQGMTVHELTGEGWRGAAHTAGGTPVVVRKSMAGGNWWLFGADIAAVARLHRTVTRRGVIHSSYDRDTACGLERLSRLLVNACAYDVEGRPARTPALRCALRTNKESLDFGDDLHVQVRLLDTMGRPVSAACVRVGLVYEGGSFGRSALPERFIPAEPGGDGTYRVSVPLRRDGYDDGRLHLPPAPGAVRYGGQRLLRILVDARRPGFVPDLTAKVVRVGPESDYAERVATLKHLIRSGLVRCVHDIDDRERFVELTATVLVPAEPKVGESSRFDITVTRVEREDGDDWLQDLALVLRPADGGGEVVVPLQPQMILASARAPVVQRQPGRVHVVTASSPANLTARWTPTKQGRYALLLRYRYSDQYHIETTDRIACEDELAGLTVTVTR
jgi:hypothetical protein